MDTTQPVVEQPQLAAQTAVTPTLNKRTQLAVELMEGITLTVILLTASFLFARIGSVLYS